LPHAGEQRAGRGLQRRRELLGIPAGFRKARALLRKAAMNVSKTRRRVLPFVIGILALLAGASGGLFGVCGPFTDVSDAAFCPFVLEIFTLGITTGTSPTTYDPGSPVTRLQMAAFLSRSVDSVLQRGHRRVLLRK